MRLLALALLFLFAASALFGQDAAVRKESATLSDEFERITADYLSSRVKSFAIELSKTSSRGMVVISSARDLARHRYSKQREIEGLLECEKSEKPKVEFRYADRAGGFQVQFWIVPEDAAAPEFWSVPKWASPLALPFMERDFKLPQLDERWNVAEEFLYGCRTYDGVDDFVAFLTANPNLRGKAVIRAASDREFQKEMGSLRARLNNLGRNRVKFVRKAPDDRPNELILEPRLIKRRRRGVLQPGV